MSSTTTVAHFLLVSSSTTLPGPPAYALSSLRIECTK